MIRIEERENESETIKSYVRKTGWIKRLRHSRSTEKGRYRFVRRWRGEENNRREDYLHEKEYISSKRKRNRESDRRQSDKDSWRTKDQARWKIREKLRGRQSELDKRRTRFDAKKIKKYEKLREKLRIEREKEKDRRRKKDRGIADRRDRASQIKERVRFPTKGERGKRPGWES